MEDDFQVQLSEDITIDGDHPIVILGPNGSGKSRFGAERLANQNNAEFIPALRGIVLNHNLPKQSFLQADQELKSAITKAPLNYWRLTNDIDQLFAKLLAEDNESAVSFRDQYLSGESTEPEKTNLMLLRDVWKEIFPGRQIDFSTYRPTVRSELGQKSAEYQASKMSDGEKVALYLGARVLNTESRILIIDEPEVHFHSRLAIRFWDTIENLRPDVRFIYITHDLPFALSREQAQFVIVRQGGEPELLSLDKNLQRGIAESILGAASFSIYARRIVFCEGNESSDDFLLFSSWFRERETVVIPVGSGTDVVQCVKAFENKEIM